jgi:radical SAM-linked protein
VRLRIRSSKLGKVRFTSSRDTARIWERALRRANLPVALSAGFTPRPKISFGLALPTGAESTAEYVDIELRPDTCAADLDAGALAGRLSDALPIGFDALVVAARPDGKGSLQEDVTTCTWQLWSPRLTAEDCRAACQLLAADTLVLERERKGKRSVDDLRPTILDLRVAEGGTDDPFTHLPEPSRELAMFPQDGARLIADLATDGRAIRPSELAELAFPGLDARDVRALRTHQWIDGADGRREVLELHPLPARAPAGPATTQAVPA